MSARTVSTTSTHQSSPRSVWMSSVAVVSMAIALSPIALSPAALAAEPDRENRADVVVNVGDVVSAGTTAISETTTGDNIGVTAGNVTATGDNAGGVFLMANDGTVTLNVGFVGTNGDHAIAISAEGDDGVDVAITGDVTTDGVFSDGVLAQSLFGNVFVQSAGAITTLQDYSHAVSAATLNGVLDINIAGDIETSGIFSYGIRAASGLDGLSISSGDITTSGDLSDGINILSDGWVIVDMDGDITTNGDNADGIDAAVSAGILMATQGITTNGADSVGIRINSTGGDVGINIHSEITTFGDRSHGVSSTTQDGDNEVSSLSSVFVAGFQSHGIQTNTSNGDTYIAATNIMTLGDLANGIDVTMDGGDLDIHVDSVETLGEGGYAIDIDADINTTTPGAPVMGDINLRVGSVITHRGAARGINLVVIPDVEPGTLMETGDIDLEIGNLETYGGGARALTVYNRWGDGALTVNLGTASTEGYDTDIVSITNGGAVDVTVTGAMTAAGRSANGIVALSATSVSLDVGDITLDGDYGRGLWASDYTIDPSGDSLAWTRLDIRSRGLITLMGFKSMGMLADSNFGDITMSANDLISHGDQSHGMFAFAHMGDVDISVMGDIEMRGADSWGVMAIAPSTIDGSPFVDDAHSLITINVHGSILHMGDVTDCTTIFPSCGDAIVAWGGVHNVTIHAGALVRSDHGAAFRSIGGAEDNFNLHGTIIGDVLLGDEADYFGVHGSANIAGIGVVDGGNGEDWLGFTSWSGTASMDQFSSFERLTLIDSNLAFSAGTVSSMTFEKGIDLFGNTSLRLGNGTQLNAKITIGFDSVLQMFDVGYSQSALVGNVLALGSISLQDGAGDDVAVIDGNIIGSATIALDVGFANGAVTANDALLITGTTGDLLIDINPYLGHAPGTGQPLLTLTGNHGSVALANGPLDFGGYTFDLVGQSGAAAADIGKDASNFAGGLSLASTGYSAQGSTAIALPAIVSGIDHNLIADRATRRGSASHDDGSAIWGRMTLETLDGVADGVGYDIDNRLVQLGADIHRSDLGGGELVASLLFHHGQAEGDLNQSGAAGPNIDLASTGFGASLGWEDTDTGSYIEMTGLLTQRRVSTDTLHLDGQGVHVSLEAGTHLQFGERTQLTPLAQLVYGRSSIDSFEDPTSGIHMKAGSVRNFRLRAGGQLAHAVNQDWTFEASAFLDLETEDSTDTFLPAGAPGNLELGGTGGEIGLRMVGDLGGWQVFGGASARWAGGDDGADAVSGQIGVRRQF